MRPPLSHLPMITAQTPIDSDPVMQMLSTRAMHVLMLVADIKTVGELAVVDRATAGKWRSCGAVTLAEFDRLLRSAGLWWGGQHSGDIEAVRARLKELEARQAARAALENEIQTTRRDELARLTGIGA